MAKTNKKTPQPVPEMQEARPETNVVEFVQPGSKRTVYDEFQERLISDGSKRALALNEAKQRLAEAADYFKAGEQEAGKAALTANQAMHSLFRGQIDGLITAKDVSNTLGEIFGFEMKKNGQPGATPSGQGAEMRKRIVRAVSAWEYVNEKGEPDRFFEGLPKKAQQEMLPIINDLEEGSGSFWQAYHDFSAIKREHTESVNAAFDPKKVRKMAEELATAKGIEALRENEALIEAYAELRATIEYVGQAALEETSD